MKLLRSLTLWFAMAFLYSFVAWRLWTWFAVPAGAPVIAFVQAFGIYLLTVTIKLWAIITPDGPAKDVGKKAAAKASIALINLGVGYVAHLFLT